MKSKLAKYQGTGDIHVRSTNRRTHKKLQELSLKRKFHKDIHEFYEILKYISKENAILCSKIKTKRLR